MNAVQIVGRLTKEVELRRTQSGKAVATYSLAVKRPRAKDEVDFVNVVTWEKAAEYLAQYSNKGDVVAVNGSLQSRKWEDKNGNKRTEWEVVTDSVELVSSKKNSEGNNNTTQNQNGYPGGYSQPQQGFQQPQYSQQGFSGYQAPQQWEPLTGDDASLPF